MVFGERRQVFGGDDGLHRNGTQVDELEIVAGLQRIDRGRIEADAETRRLAEQAEEHGLVRVAERASLGQ